MLSSLGLFFALSLNAPAAASPPAGPLFQFKKSCAELERVADIPVRPGDGFGLELLGIRALNKDLVYLYGSRRAAPGDIASLLLRSRDQGRSWVEAMEPLPGSQVIELHFLPSGEGWALILWTVEGPGDLFLFHSLDSGMSWKRHSQIPKEEALGYPGVLEFKNARMLSLEMIYEDSSRERVALLSSKDGGMRWRKSGEKPKSARSRPRNPFSSQGLDASLWQLEVPAWGSKKRDFTVRGRPSLGKAWEAAVLIPGHIECPKAKR